MSLISFAIPAFAQEEIEEIKIDERPTWNRWEAGLDVGRMLMSSSAWSQDAMVGGLQVLYRFKGIGNAPDGTKVELQGRHGVALNIITYDTNYGRKYELYSGTDILPLVVIFDELRMDVPTARFNLITDGAYRYTIVSATYVYTHLSKYGKLRKLGPYIPIGLGYAFGSHKIGLDASYEPAETFFRFEFNDTPVYIFGGGLRWQINRKWVLNAEIKDFLMKMDDSHFRRRGLMLNEFEWHPADTYGHNFYIHFVISRSFPKLLGF